MYLGTIINLLFQQFLKTFKLTRRIS